MVRGPPKCRCANRQRACIPGRAGPWSPGHRGVKNWFWRRLRPARGDTPPLEIVTDNGPPIDKPVSPLGPR
jgi:hypothetical protein